MSRNQYNTGRKISLACYSLLIAVFVIVSTPSLAKADNRSNNCNFDLSKEWHSAVKTSMNTLKQVVTGNADSYTSLHGNLSAEEIQMISFINQERAKAGLNELIIDDSLVKLAREKSMDMVSHNYFGHNSRRFGTVYDQLRREQVSYQRAAENLAGSGNVHQAEQYLFSSPMHRWNILNPRFTKIGVGIVRGGPFGAMITQLFLG